MFTRYIIPSSEVHEQVFSAQRRTARTLPRDWQTAHRRGKARASSELDQEGRNQKKKVERVHLFFYISQRFAQRNYCALYTHNGVLDIITHYYEPFDDHSGQ